MIDGHEYTVQSQVLDGTGELEARELSNLEAKLSPKDIVLSVFLFLIAGIAEVGGGFLVWRGIREKIWPALYIPIGSIILVIYGFIPTFQPMTSFGRIFAIYGGFFIVLSYAWGYFFDGLVIDKGDLIGSAIALIGVLVCWFWPR